MKPVRPEQLLQHRYISDICFSQGEEAAFVVRSSTDDQLGYSCELWLYKNGATERLIGLDGSPKYWWEDAQHILISGFYEEADKKKREFKAIFTAFYRVNIQTGEKERAFEVPFSANEIYRYSETKWLMKGTIDAEYPDLFKLDYPERAAIDTGMREESGHYQVVDELPFYYNGMGMVNKKRNALFLVDVENNSCCRLTDPFFNVSYCTVVGDTIFYSGKRYTTKMPPKEGLFQIDPQSGKTECIIEDNTCYFSGMCAMDSCLVFLANSSDSYWKSADFYTLEPGSKKYRC